MNFFYNINIAHRIDFLFKRFQDFDNVLLLFYCYYFIRLKDIF